MIITGIKTRTNNKNSFEIGKLWEKFFKINKDLALNNNDEFFAVYYNYELDLNGDFDVLEGNFDILIGIKSENIKGFESLEIEDGNYKEYKTSGNFPQKVIDGWEKIWKDDLKRNFKTDYEVYTKSLDEKNPNVSIFI